MNVLEHEMVEILKKLKDYGCFQIKAEFEAEGSRMVELMRLKDIISKVDLPLILKIGGVEAITDIYDALSLGAEGIVAPMAETPFAVSKFLNAIEKYVPEDNRVDIEFAINIETITAYNNAMTIMRLPKLYLLNSITFGRVDFTNSIGKDRNFTESVFVKNHFKQVFVYAKQYDLKTALGGAISMKSKSTVKTLLRYDLLDKFETRKVVFNEWHDEGIKLAVQFELLWLKSKRRYYHRLRDEDEKRIIMLEGRL